MEELFHNLQIRMAPTRYGVVLAAVILCGATDLWRFRVYNIVTIPLLISGLAYHAMSPVGERVGFAVVGAALGAALLAPFCALGGVGAGDVKLLAGVGAWIGAYDVLVVFIVTGFLVGLYSVSVIAVTARWRDLPAWFKRVFGEPRFVQGLLRRPAHVDDVAAHDAPQRRTRLVPMAAMMAAAIGLLLIAQALRGTS